MTKGEKRESMLDISDRQQVRALARVETMVKVYYRERRDWRRFRCRLPDGRLLLLSEISAADRAPARKAG